MPMALSYTSWAFGFYLLSYPSFFMQCSMYSPLSITLGQLPANRIQSVQKPILTVQSLTLFLQFTLLMFLHIELFILSVVWVSHESFWGSLN